MALRQIYKVFATQIVTSPSNPQGLLSDVQGYPKAFDSRDYKSTTENPNGDQEIALYAAREEFNKEVKTLSISESATRVGWVVSIIRTSDGERIDRKAWGGYPDMTPEPQPEPEPEEEPEAE